jgi:hypothetical protein
MDAHLMVKEHHNQCMKKVTATEAQHWSLPGMNGVVPAYARAGQIACIQNVTLYGSTLWYDPKKDSRPDDIQVRLN